MNSNTLHQQGRLNCIKNIFFYTAVLTATLIFNSGLQAQNVLITDDSTYVPKSSAILDVKAVGKGILMPRVKLTSTSSALPVTLPDSSLMVYNDATAGDVTPGYYYWIGSKWVRMANGQGGLTEVTKTASATLLQSETMVLASNDITLTLPLVTIANDGLEITIKNMGGYKDLVTVNGNSGAMIDNLNGCYLTRWRSETYIASNGNWILKFRQHHLDNTYNVDYNGSWKTIQEVLEFLKEHMFEPSVVLLCGGTYSISETQVIDLPYPLTIEAATFGTATIKPASGLAGKPLFRCLTECYFKMLMFDASLLADYGTLPGEDAIRLVGSGKYHEIKDCTFDYFYNAIVDSTDAELWLFECDISNAQNNGLYIHGNVPGVKIRVSETDFISCKKGINLDKGSLAVIQVNNGAFLNMNATDSAIIYRPGTFSFSSMLISNNSWNTVGVFIAGFDFTRSDGRDAYAFLQSNAGVGDSKPKCRLNVKDNVSTTTITAANTYYKAVWTNTSSSTCKWTVANNKITYQTVNRTNGFAVITGNIACDHNSVLTIGLVKNGVSSIRHGECNLKVTAANVPFQFSTVIYLEDISKDDYFELYVTSSRANDLVTFQDVQWYIESK